MRRIVFVALLACGGTQPAHVTEVPLPAASTSAAHTRAPPQARPFELSVTHRLCMTAHGKVHCRDTLDPRKRLSDVPTLAGLESVSVKSFDFGRDFGCVATREGTALCFGGNHFGQLGAHVRDAQHESPTEVVGLRGVRRVVVGPAHACAILEGGKVACWGKNQFGETGSDTNYLEQARELVEAHVVPGVDDVEELALAWDATCAVTRGGQTLCWGKAKLSGDTGGEVPAAIPALDGVTSVTANEEAFCGVKDHKVVCWGQVFMLTPQTAGSFRNADVTEVGIDHAKQVSLGSLHGCAVDDAGSVYCFGTNQHGDLGVPPVANSYSAVGPTKVAGLPRAALVLAGGGLSCAITVTDEAYCWGRFGWNDGGGDEPVAHAPERVLL